VVVLWLGCRCLPSVNTICGCIMIGLSLSSVSKHNMWSYHDWVVIGLTEDNDNPIIIQPHIVFTDGRQRQPNHNTTTYCVYWPKTTTTQSEHDHILCLLTDDNPVIIRPHIVFTDGRQQRQPNNNTITYCSYWRKTINRNIIRPHIVFTDGRQQRPQYVVVLW
jgi:hypothetical protein